MKALLAARRSVLRLVLAALILVAAVTALLVSTASVAAPGHTGQALALRQTLESGLPPQAASKSSAASGRFAFPRNYYQRLTRAALRAAGLRPNVGTGTILINEGVQTFDVFAPPPGFQPGDGPLAPTNLQPVWTSDGRSIVFSSNRSADGHFHLWAISANGDNPLDLSATTSLHQITTSTGDEFFPALSPATPPSSNAQLAFVSTANQNGVQNLYTVDNFDAGATQVNVNNLVSLTIRNTGGPNDLNTHFGEVDRPTWSPGSDRLVFSAVDRDGPNVGVHHLWSLFINSGGGTPDSNGPSPTNPPAKLTTGPANDTDPAWTPDSAADLIAFATTAPAGGFTAGQPAVSAAGGATRSIFVIKSNGTAPTQITTAGQDDFGPAWNVNPAFAGYLTFARGATPAANHGIFFLPTVYTQATTTTLNPETGASAIQINTDDLPTRGNPGNLFTKVYPSWSPFLTTQSVVYSSNRSVTYNNPATGAPVESAISLAPGTPGVGPGYMGLLISRYDDVDPPTFLPYSAGENIHITNGTDNRARRNGDIAPGGPVTFTVRLSNREAGVDDNNVYLQIKDPDSMYQDAQGLEHKVFTQDVTDSVNQANAGQPDSYLSTPVGYTLSTTDDLTPQIFFAGSNTVYLYNGGAGGSGYGFFADNSPLFALAAFTNRPPPAPQVSAADIQTIRAYGNQFSFRDNIAEAEQVFTVGGGQYPVQQRGAVAGRDGTTFISVGVDPGAGQVPSPITINVGNPAMPVPIGFVDAVHQGGDPATFRSSGQEYECQFLDASYNLGGAVDTSPTDYGTPFYLAGVDDQGAHSGGSHPPPTDANDNLTWLRLNRAPDAQQDGQGGVLYTATWTTPTSPSDYYLDVIAYDKAVLPETPSQTAANWRVYDNIYGFSTQAFQGGRDILVISDNTLGQKFVGSTFGGNGLENIPPIFYGAESYFTDIDISLLPNAIYRYASQAGKVPAFHTALGQPGDVAVLLPDTFPVPEVRQLTASAQPALVLDPSGRTLNPIVLNGLGVNSYTDGLIAAQTSNISGLPVPVSQQYSLWRILARGAVDPQVLNAYSPTLQTQPAVNDPLTGFTAPAATVPVNTRCVIWTAPYTGNLPLNTVGSIADGAVQNELRAFIQGGTFGTVTFAGGGRLFVSGAGVATTLGATTASNTAGSFLTDVLNASSVGTSTNSFIGGSQNLSGGAQNLGFRISGDAFFNPSIGAGIVQDFFTQDDATLGFVYAAPNSQPLILGNNYIEFPPRGRPELWRTDGSLDQLGPLPSTFGLSSNIAQSQIGLITPQNGATADASFNVAGPGFDPQTGGTGAGLIYKLNAGPNGARVAFSSFGLEGIGIEYYKVTRNNVESFYARNQRPNILHNMVCFLRTATISGTITQGSSGGQSAANATVYLIPDGGTIPGGAAVRQTYSALTAGNGSFQIQGVEPGAYFLVAYKTGFNRVETPVAKIVEGDTSASFNLNLIPIPPGSITGRVVDTSGNGIAGATLTFTSADGLTRVTGTTRADGTYTIVGVPPTSYNSLVTAQGFGTKNAPDPPTANPFAVPSGQTIANVNFTLAPIPGTVGGLVLDDFNGQPVGGATITVKNQALQPVLDANGAPIVFTTTATAPNTPTGGITGDGQPANFLGSLPQGTYVLTLTPPANYLNPTPATATVTVVSGAFVRVAPFTLTSTLGALAGTVTDAGTGAPVAGATVTVTQTNAPAGTTNTQTFTTAADGTYGPAPLTQGTYTLSVAAATYRTQTLPAFPIVAHQTATKNVALVSTLGTFGGLVTDALSGLPLAGASVSITDATGAAVGGSPLTTTTATAASPPNATGGTSPINFGPVTLPAVDANGRPLVYNVTVTKQGNGTATRPDYNPSQTFSVTLTPGRFTAQNVPLVFAIGALGGRIADSFSGQLLIGSTITVADATGSVLATLTGRSTESSPAAPLGDGRPLNYSTGLTLYGGTGTVYTVTATATDHTTASVRVTVVGSQFTRQDFALVSTIGTVGGLVLDSSTGAPVAGATVTIKDAAGAVVTTYNTTATTSTPAAPVGDAHPLNYSGPLKQGGYSATVTKRGYGTSAAQPFSIGPNQFTRIDFSGATYGLPPAHVFPAGFNFFSVPYDYAATGVGFDQLFGALNTGTRAAPSAGSNRSHIFVWSPQLVQYVLDPQAPADGLHLGQGYWVYLLGPSEVTAPASPPTARSIPVLLRRGWNQIGVPSLKPIGVSALTFNNPATGGTISFVDASSTTYRLVSSPLYGYNGTNYVAVTAGGTLDPWQSYWIYAFADTTVNIPTS